MGNVECCREAAHDDLPTLSKRDTNKNRRTLQSQYYQKGQSKPETPQTGSQTIQNGKMPDQSTAPSISGYLRVQSFESKFDDLFLKRMSSSNVLDVSKIYLSLDLNTSQTKKYQSKDTECSATDTSGLTLNSQSTKAQSKQVMDLLSNGSQKSGLQPSQRHKPSNISNRDIAGIELHEIKPDQNINFKLIYLLDSEQGRGYLTLSENNLLVGQVLDQLDKTIELQMLAFQSENETEMHPICHLQIKFQFHDLANTPNSISSFLRLNKVQKPTNANDFSQLVATDQKSSERGHSGQENHFLDNSNKIDTNMSESDYKTNDQQSKNNAKELLTSQQISLQKTVSILQKYQKSVKQTAKHKTPKRQKSQIQISQSLSQNQQSISAQMHKYLDTSRKKGQARKRMSHQTVCECINELPALEDMDH